MIKGGTEAKMEKLISQVDDYRPDQASAVVSMQKSLKMAMLKKNLREHPALLQLLAVLKKREEAYTLILSNKEDLTDVKRQGYFDRRTEIRFIISFFEVDKTIESIDKQLDYQLSNDVEGVDNKD